MVPTQVLSRRQKALETKGAFFWDFSIDSLACENRRIFRLLLWYFSVAQSNRRKIRLFSQVIDSFSGIRITEQTEYQFPKEQTLCYSENRIADMTNIKAMRPRKSGYANFPSKDRQKLPKEHDYRLFCLFQTNYTVYSVNSAIGSRIDGILFLVQVKNRRQMMVFMPRPKTRGINTII